MRIQTNGQCIDLCYVFKGYFIILNIVFKCEDDINPRYSQNCSMLHCVQRVLILDLDFICITCIPYENRSYLPSADYL